MVGWGERVDLEEKKSVVYYCFYLLLYMFIIYFIIWSFTGKWPLLKNDYNSYALQAKAWLKGHLDLGQNYSYLEIAIYKGKYYISFPPFPSYLLLPFAFLFGSNTPDHLIALTSIFIGSVYAFRLAKTLGRTNQEALFWSIFLVGASNLVFVSVNGWVWFFAQNLAFTLSIVAIYYALKGNGGVSLFLWACSIGCRPFQIIYFPILFVILWKGVTEKRSIRLGKFLYQSKHWLIAPGIIGISYMMLNYFRFGNIFEFGHNYLPEFINSKNGQFSTVYFSQNIHNLFRLPTIGVDHKIVFPVFDGVAFWLVSPIFISYLLYVIYKILQRDTKDFVLNTIVFITLILHLLILTLHKTMGGWHFGNRYTNDLLAYVFLGIMLLIPNKDAIKKVHYPFCFFGILINIIGAIAVYNNWM